jgi:hypothetical protein
VEVRSRRRARSAAKAGAKRPPSLGAVPDAGVHAGADQGVGRILAAVGSRSLRGQEESHGDLAGPEGDLGLRMLGRIGRFVDAVGSRRVAGCRSRKQPTV